jgi:hypothetical protein
MHMPIPNQDRAPTEQFFRELEGAPTRARGDRAFVALEALHAPEYELVTPAGKVFSRQAYLGAIAAAPFYVAWGIESMSVRLSEQMAVVRYLARLQFPSGRVVVCWHTDVYERRVNGWQAVWSQATEVSQPNT